MLIRTSKAVAAGAMVICLLLGRAWADAPPKPATAPIRVFIITGAGDHDWRTSSSTLRRVLTDTGRFDVRVCESPVGLTARTLAEYDLVVVDFAGPTTGGETEAAIAGFVASGKGLVVTHGGLKPLQGDRPAGLKPHKVPPAYSPVVSMAEPHTPVQFFDVKLTQPEHPIVKGMNGAFRTADSLPRGLVAGPSAEVLATAVDQSGGKEVPVLIVSAGGKGRVVCVGLGHDGSAMNETAFGAMFARASEWAATGAVTLPAEPGPVPPKTGRVKGLLITGGHDHDAAFYTPLRRLRRARAVADSDERDRVQERPPRQVRRRHHVRFHPRPRRSSKEEPARLRRERRRRRRPSPRPPELPELDLVGRRSGRRQLSAQPGREHAVVDRQERPADLRHARREHTRSPRVSDPFTSRTKPTRG